MRHLYQFIFLSIICLIAGCATNQLTAYKDLASSSKLVPNTQSKNKHILFYYAAPSYDLKLYNRFILDPVVIYRGADQQFNKMSEADKIILAQYMQQQLVAALKSKYIVAAAPGPHTLRIRVTLTGAETTVPVLGTLTQLFPIGAVVNTFKSTADQQDKLLGSAYYAVEVYDSHSNQLLRAYVGKQYPAAENIAAGFGALSAPKTAIQKAAQELVAELQ